MGYLRKIGEKKFRIVYNLAPVNGRRRQKTETLLGVTKKQAEAVLVKRQEAAAAADAPSDSEMGMNDLFDRFMQVKSDRLAPTTLQRYEGLLQRYLRPAFGKRRVSSVKATELVGAYARWSKGPVKARTVRACCRSHAERPEPCRQVGRHPTQSSFTVGW